MKGSGGTRSRGRFQGRRHRSPPGGPDAPRSGAAGANQIEGVREDEEPEA